VINAEKELQQEPLEQNQRVYDIMVEDKHEFFANNILVHNCLDYFMTSAFASDYENYQKGDNGLTYTLGKNKHSKHGY
jgi:hypothetical protein